MHSKGDARTRLLRVMVSGSVTDVSCCGWLYLLRCRGRSVVQQSCHAFTQITPITMHSHRLHQPQCIHTDYTNHNAFTSRPSLLHMHTAHNANHNASRSSVLHIHTNHNAFTSRSLTLQGYSSCSPRGLTHPTNQSSADHYTDEAYIL